MSDRIGGKILLAMIPPGKEIQQRWLDYYQNEIDRLGVTLKLAQEVTVEDVEAFGADVVLVATGGRPLLPKTIAGLDHPLVVTSDDVLLGTAEVGNNVAIIGGSSMGVETADFILKAEGKKVMVLEMLHDILTDISHDAELALLDKLYKKDFRFATSTRVKSIEPSNGQLDLHVQRYAYDDVISGFDTVVMAVGVAPDNTLGLALQEKMSNVFLIGDAAGAGDYRKAVHDAAEVALTI
jgi:2-enoate reductase